MKIAVCIKQVPDSTQVKVDPKTGTLIRAGVPSILNPYDHFALEAALALKEKNGGEVIVVSMGPSQAKAVIRLAQALGADTGILLCDRAFAGSDTWATAYALSRALRKIGKLDLIICGQMAIDGDTAQTGPAVAQMLHLPQITFCERIDVRGRTLRAKKHIDDGFEVLEATLPVLCTMTMPHDYKPKYPSFPAVARSEAKPFELWTAQDVGAEEQYCGLNGSPTRVDRVYAPPQRKPGAVINGSAAELADRLVEILKKESFVK